MDYKSVKSLLLRLAGVIILVAAVIAAPRNFVSLYLRDAGGGINTEIWLLTTAASILSDSSRPPPHLLSSDSRQQDRLR
jgi:hypothetical protein